MGLAAACKAVDPGQESDAQSGLINCNYLAQPPAAGARFILWILDWIRPGDEICLGHAVFFYAPRLKFLVFAINSERRLSGQHSSATLRDAHQTIDISTGLKLKNQRLEDEGVHGTLRPGGLRLGRRRPQLLRLGIESLGRQQRWRWLEQWRRVE